jgi:3-methyl-2-oxobutanoate hydroxymethyltransferase
MLGMDHRFRPRFLKTYADLDTTIRLAFESYATDVRTRSYPDSDYSFKTPAEALAALSSEQLKP